jgi:ABC-type lipoprotein release transport system permease subunit
MISKYALGWKQLLSKQAKDYIHSVKMEIWHEKHDELLNILKVIGIVFGAIFISIQVYAISAEFRTQALIQQETQTQIAEYLLWNMQQNTEIKYLILK